ncbi:MAG TPA: type II secretion system protein GspN [Spirochaetota bacterium]|nr:type II secretion system protein GspN [Spirochaetota bacterium]HOM09723.1 type II secretion system protein GspN [Spirochaetota bacterium]HPP49478.1 type II secretion system protein GspN [Spirochaetota bacterium]
MNLSNYKIILKTYFDRLYNFLKEIVTVQYFWRYLVFSIVMVILFVFLTFPYEIIIQNKIKEVEQNIANYISIGRLKIHTITDSIAEDITIELKNGTEITLQNVLFNFTINPFSIFITHHYDGTIKIHNLNLKGEKLQIITNADILYDLKYNKPLPYPAEGNIISSMKDVSIKGISIQGFEIPDINISQIKSELIFEKGNMINLKYLLFSGSEIRGNAYGTITLSNYFQNSSLNITIQIDSQSSILEDYKVLLESMMKAGTKNITIKIMGTIGNPNFVTQ